MSDQNIVFVEVHSHNFRHFFHQQRWAVIQCGTTGIPVISRQSLRAYYSIELIQLDPDIKTTVAELVYIMSSLISLIWLFTPSLCSFTSLIVDITLPYFFEIKFWTGTFQFRRTFLEVEKTSFKRVDFLADFLSDIGKKVFLPTSLLNFPQLISYSGLNSVRLNSPPAILVIFAKLGERGGSQDCTPASIQTAKVML